MDLEEIVETLSQTLVCGFPREIRDDVLTPSIPLTSLIPPSNISASFHVFGKICFYESCLRVEARKLLPKTLLHQGHMRMTKAPC